MVLLLHYGVRVRTTKKASAACSGLLHCHSNRPQTQWLMLMPTDNPPLRWRRPSLAAPRHLVLSLPSMVNLARSTRRTTSITVQCMQRFGFSSQDAQREGGGRRERRQEDRGVDCFVRTVLRLYPQVPALMDLVEDPPFPCWPPAPFIVIIKNWAFCHLFTLFPLLQRIPVERRWTRWVKVRRDISQHQHAVPSPSVSYPVLLRQLF